MKVVRPEDVEELVAMMLKHWRWQPINVPQIKTGSMGDMVDDLWNVPLIVEVKTTHADTRQRIRSQLKRMGVLSGMMGEWEIVTVPWDEFTLYVRLDRE